PRPQDLDSIALQRDTQFIGLHEKQCTHLASVAVLAAAKLNDVTDIAAQLVVVHLDANVVNRKVEIEETDKNPNQQNQTLYILLWVFDSHLPIYGVDDEFYARTSSETGSQTLAKS